MRALKNPIAALAAVLALGLAAGAVADSPKTMARNLAELEQFALPPIDEIRSYRFYDWKPLGDTRLALWTRPNRDVYIIEVFGPCMDLPWAHSIAVGSGGAVLSARFDSVRFGRDSCRIRSIRPVDWRALREWRKAERAERRR